MSNLVRSNVNIIRDQIEAKVSYSPFLASQNAVPLTVTDQDTFPYPRHYRGIYQVSEPVVFEREAGWRQRHDSCYIPERVYEPSNPQYCWQVPCSTVFPCRKTYSPEALAVAQAYSCVNISR
jgi:hypothetical protein|tara:strand:+ start:459 stop:824 length:366 start_codon:yes stop_codon:yes gene_type:complete